MVAAEGLAERAAGWLGNLAAGCEGWKGKEKEETEGARGHNAKKRRGCFADCHPSDVSELLLYY